LILRKINKTGAIRCQILRLKYTKFNFRWGSTPDPSGGLQCSPDSLAVFKGHTTKKREGEGEEKEEGKGGLGRVAHPPNWGVWIRQWSAVSTPAVTPHKLTCSPQLDPGVTRSRFSGSSYKFFSSLASSSHKT